MSNDSFRERCIKLLKKMKEHSKGIDTICGPAPISFEKQESELEKAIQSAIDYLEQRK